MRILLLNLVKQASLILFISSFFSSGQAMEPIIDVGVEGGGGYSSLQSDVEYEISKTGTNVFEDILVNTKNNKHKFEFNLGYNYTKLNGDDDKRGIHQTFKLPSLRVGTTYSYKLPYELSAGIGINMLVGPGTKFDVAYPKKFSIIYYIRPIIQYIYPLGEFNPFARIGYMQNLNNNSRNVKEISASIGVYYSIDVSKVAPEPAHTFTPVPSSTVTPEPTLTAIPVPEPIPVVTIVPEPTITAMPMQPNKEVSAPKPFVLQLGNELVNFNLASSKLNQDSEKRLGLLGAILAKYSNVWSYLKITGHTDARGKNSVNKKLSKERAFSVRKALINAGVQQDKIGAEGFASSKPLPGKNPNAPENRRVELEFSQIFGEKAIEMQQEILEVLK